MLVIANFVNLALYVLQNVSNYVIIFQIFYCQSLKIICALFYGCLVTSTV